MLWPRLLVTTPGPSSCHRRNCPCPCLHSPVSLSLVMLLSPKQSLAHNYWNKLLFLLYCILNLIMRRLRATKWKIKRCHFMTNQQKSIFHDNKSSVKKRNKYWSNPRCLSFSLGRLGLDEDVLWLCLNKTNYRGVWTNFVDNNSNFHPALYERAGESSLGPGSPGLGSTTYLSALQLIELSPASTNTCWHWDCFCVVCNDNRESLQFCVNGASTNLQRRWRPLF